jgi:peptidoglycan hydrolase-like protein with peptidoglycan-binding domain
MLLQAIERHSGEAPVVPPTPTQPVPIAPQTVISIGATGDKVKEIQKIVGVDQDGIFGPKTASAVKAWQTNLNISADGIWGPQTEEATHNLFVFLTNLPVVEEINPNNEFFQAIELARSHVLRQNSTGGDVTILQALLNAKGYALVQDSIFGARTHNAVVRYQQDHGLMVDGVVGRQTWDSLLS